MSLSNSYSRKFSKNGRSLQRNGPSSSPSSSGNPVYHRNHKKQKTASRNTWTRSNDHMMHIGSNKLVMRRPNVVLSNGGSDVWPSEFRNDTQFESMKKVGANKLVAKKTNQEDRTVRSDSPKASPMTRLGRNKLVLVSKVPSQGKSDSMELTSARSEALERVGSQKIVMSQSKNDTTGDTGKSTEAVCKPVDDERFTYKSAPANMKKRKRHTFVADKPPFTSTTWKKPVATPAPICIYFQRKGMCFEPNCKFAHIKVNPRAAAEAAAASKPRQKKYVRR